MACQQSPPLPPATAASRFPPLAPPTQDDKPKLQRTKTPWIDPKDVPGASGIKFAEDEAAPQASRAEHECCVGCGGSAAGRRRHLADQAC